MNPVELYSHLKSQCPTGVVIGGRRRCTWIGNVVWIILRFEHCQEMRPKSLSSLNHVGARGIGFPGDLEGTGSLMDGDAVFDEGIHKFGGC
jgi:hypothetical protein